jgi:hypothetical protein
MTEEYNSLNEYISLVKRNMIINTQVLTKYAEGIHDSTFIKAIETANLDYSVYIMSSALIKLSIRSKRFSLAKKLIPIALSAFKKTKSEDDYTYGIKTSILIPAIRASNNNLVTFAVNIISKHTKGRLHVEIDDFLEAAKLDKDIGIKITNSLLKCPSSDRVYDINIRTMAALKASENKIKWQVEQLVDSGAKINELSEINIRKIFGSKKNSLLNLTEKRKHILDRLLHRYLDQKNNTPNPIDYLGICPEWQKPIVMEHITNI